MVETESNPRLNKALLIKMVKAQFRCDWHGIHGPSHWARVRLNGLHLANAHRGNAHVVELFSLLHDTKRMNEDYDPLHGKRAAEYAEQLRGVAFEANEQEMALLIQACSLHSDGMLDADITVQCCWDADRLDLWRVGVEPNPNLLCTEEARLIATQRKPWPSTRSGQAGTGFSILD